MSGDLQSICLLGVRFHMITKDQLLRSVLHAAQRESKTIIGHVNAHGLNIAYKLPWYREFLNRADLVFCDGFGVLLGAKIMGFPVQPAYRMTCPDYIEDLVLACEKANIALYLLAGKPDIIQQAITRFRSIAPCLRISGHHGYFAKEGPDNDRIIADINTFQPDVLYIGFGMPLQERWIKDNAHRINARVFLPLGACLDFYTGAVYRGPSWLTDHGLEWLTRLLTEPQRLWRRYLLGNPLFLWRILRQRAGLLRLSAEEQKDDTDVGR